MEMLYCVAHKGATIYRTQSKASLQYFLSAVKSKGLKNIVVYHKITNKEVEKLVERLDLGKGRILRGAREKFGSENIIVIDGDLFYIEESDGVTFVGKKVTNELTLSEERFRIEL